MEHRRSLPHIYVPGAAHFVTYRLAGTLPIRTVEELKQKKTQLLASKPQTAEHRRHVHKVLFAAYEKYLDQVSAIDWLRDPRIAAIIRQNLYHHHEKKYHLHAYCVMPNHVHVLFTPFTNERRRRADTESAVGETSDKLSPLTKIMHSLKSYTANQANKVLRRSGSFWQPESYDHWVRDEDELERIVNYIRGNPVAAKLVGRHEDWFWSSCHDRFLQDGNTCGWLTATRISTTVEA